MSHSPSSHVKYHSPSPVRAADDVSSAPATPHRHLAASTSDVNVSVVDYNATSPTSADASPHAAGSPTSAASVAPTTTSTTAATAGSSTSGPAAPPPNAVYVNVYDIIGANAILAPLGIGVHHTGVEVYGSEYAFGRCGSGTGVFDVMPKTCPGHVYRESLFIGTTNLNQRQLNQVVHELSKEWRGPDYHIIRKNCNHFAKVFLHRIIDDGSSAAPMDSNDKASDFPLYCGGGTDSPSSSASDAEDPRSIIPAAGTPNGSFSPMKDAIQPVDDNESPSRGNREEKKNKKQKKRKLFPSWANRIARIATILPDSLIEKIDMADKQGQGLA